MFLPVERWVTRPLDAQTVSSVSGGHSAAQIDTHLYPVVDLDAEALKKPIFGLHKTPEIMRECFNKADPIASAHDERDYGDALGIVALDVGGVLPLRDDHLLIL